VPSSRKSRRRWVAVIVGLALAAVILPEAWHVTLGPNFHTVLEHRLYRAAQPSGATLESYIHTYGIRTVINLRGPNHGEDWFDDEVQAARRRGVNFLTVNISASDKPQEAEVRKLVEAFDAYPPPVLVHCYSGSDRSGFASACYLLTMPKPDGSLATLAEARSQLSLRYGHFPWGKAGCLSEVLDQYESWLTAQGLSHHPKRFRHWARHVYTKDDWPAERE
jgi:protein tyrosine phosphatase (PTP) superfamily phosphohydrolase (DUF442 family)